MAENNFLIKVVRAVCVWYFILNVVSSELIDYRDNCLTCTPAPPVTPTTTPPMTTTTAPPTQSSPSLPPCTNCPPQDCSTSPEGSTFPYASHCKLYYKCIDRNAVMCTCANGYWYDRQTKICELCPLVLNCPAYVD